MVFQTWLLRTAHIRVTGFGTSLDTSHKPWIFCSSRGILRQSGPCRAILRLMPPSWPVRNRVDCDAREGDSNSKTSRSLRAKEQRLKHLIGSIVGFAGFQEGKYAYYNSMWRPPPPPTLLEVMITIMDTVAGTLSIFPLLTLKVNESAPRKRVFGV